MPTEKKNCHEVSESYTFSSISTSHLTFLRMVAFLPLNNRGYAHPLSRLLQVYNHSIVFIYHAIWTCYGYQMISRRDLEVDYVCEQMIIEGVCLRYIVMCLKREQLCELIESCKRLWNYLKPGEDLIVRQFERRAHFFRNFMLSNSLMVMVLYIATAHFIRLSPLEANGTERKTLPFRFFMDVQEDPMFTAVYVLQVVVCSTIPFIIASIETVSLYLIMMACGYLRSLRNRLLNLTLSEDKETAVSGEVTFKLVVDCVHFHQQIMIFCEDVDRMTRSLFLFACFTTIYNVSIAGIQLLENDENVFKLAAILVLNMLQFLACQWAPEFLIMESEAIGEAAYFASLQPLESSHREKINQVLYFMMMRAQEPIQLTAGGFIKLSIQTFGNMVKSAFSFFAVLRSFRT